jgi:hypothetical protein
VVPWWYNTKIMAKNTQKRIPVKWIRDRAKGAYEKQSSCFVCGTQQDLELHHTHSVTLLLERWCSENGLVLDTDELVLEHRDRFISDHRAELYDQVYTLCNGHHVRLHQVFGKAPALNSASRQQRWLEIQRDKQTGLETAHKAPSYGSWFQKFT